MMKIIFITLLLATAYADDSCGKDCTWIFIEGELTIMGSGAMDDYDSFHYKYPPWNDHRREITTIIIEEGITTIGKSAFYGCTRVQSIQLPSTLTTMRDYALAYCMSLKTVDIPQAVSNIGNYTFRGCTQLQRVKYLNTNAPKGCSETTFYDCHKLANITVPSQYGVHSTSFCAFKKLVTENEDQQGKCGSDCTWSFNSQAKTLEIKGTNAMSNYKYRQSSFYLLRAYFTTVTIGEGITSLGNYTFSECTKMKSISLPSTLKKIGAKSFYKTLGLREITIPSKVATIWPSAFANCTNLVKVKYQGFEQPTCDETIFADAVNVTQITVPSQYRVNATTFCGIKKLVTDIEDQKGTCGEKCSWEFDAESSKVKITGEHQMSDFKGGRAPWYMLKTNITAVEIEEGITSIGNYSFFNLSKMETITIGEDVEMISESAFLNCKQLSTVVVKSEQMPTCTNDTFSSAKTLAEVSVPYGYADSHYCGIDIVERPEESTSNVGLIVGLTVGGAALLVILIVAGVVAGFFIYKYKANRSSYHDLQ